MAGTSGLDSTGAVVGLQFRGQRGVASSVAIQAGAAGTGFFSDTNNNILHAANGTAINFMGTTGMALATSMQLAWSSTSDPAGTPDLILTKDDADISAQRRSTNNQRTHVYGTYTDSGNYERLAIGVGIVSTNNAAVYVQQAGTGTVRALDIGTSGTGTAVNVYSAGTLQWLFNGTDLLPNTNNSKAIGSASFRPIAVFAGVSGMNSTGSVIVSTTAQHGWTSRAALLSPADGLIRMANLADTSVFTALIMGPLSTSGIALNKSAQTLQTRLGDGSAFSDIQSRQVLAAGDSAGIASMVTFTNGENATTARGSGVGTIKFVGATSADNLGFLKIYTGSSPMYIPVFAAN